MYKRDALLAVSGFEMRSLPLLENLNTMRYSIYLVSYEVVLLFGNRNNATRARGCHWTIDRGEQTQFLLPTVQTDMYVHV